jgi:hypothetical protein
MAQNNTHEANRYPTLKVAEDPHLVRIISEPFVLFTIRGYAPAVNVATLESDENYTMFLSAVSLSSAIEPLRKKNKGLFTGLEFWIRKESSDQRSPYIIEEKNQNL